MYAGVALAVVAPEKRSAYLAVVEVGWSSREQHPEFCGGILADAGVGLLMGLARWSSAEAREAGQRALAAADHSAPSLAESHTVIGEGEVVRSTLTVGTVAGYAHLSESTYRPNGGEAELALLEEFWELLSDQPGLRGAVLVDTGAGRFMTLLLWDNATQCEAAQTVLAAASQRLMGAFLTAPPHVIGEGVVIFDSLTARA